jgi:hypothetical protein
MIGVGRSHVRLSHPARSRHCTRGPRIGLEHGHAAQRRGTGLPVIPLRSPRRRGATTGHREANAAAHTTGFTTVEGESPAGTAAAYPAPPSAPADATEAEPRATPASSPCSAAGGAARATQAAASPTQRAARAPAPKALSYLRPASSSALVAARFISDNSCCIPCSGGRATRLRRSFCLASTVAASPSSSSRLVPEAATSTAG